MTWFESANARRELNSSGVRFWIAAAAGECGLSASGDSSRRESVVMSFETLGADGIGIV
jgi:hypothetical protein